MMVIPGKIKPYTYRHVVRSEGQTRNAKKKSVAELEGKDLRVDGG
jgi:hypothetical protein